MADRTQHEGKTERAKQSHDRCGQPPGMRVLKTADLGTQALLVVIVLNCINMNFIVLTNFKHSHAMILFSKSQPRVYP